MNQDGQQITQNTYENPVFIDAYIKRNALKPKQKDRIVAFSKTISGKKVLDLGCGPGHDSYIFAELGFDVIGLDFSKEMIRRAKKLKEVVKQPTFLVGDMTKLNEYFDNNEFDAIWASASLLHIRPTDISKTIKGMTLVSKNGAKIFIRLKGGIGTKLINEEKYIKSKKREFTLWTKSKFLDEVEPHGWKLDDYSVNDGSSMFMGKPTQWHNFFFTVKKSP